MEEKFRKAFWKSLKEMRKEKHIFMFLLAFFFYIDGVYTIIEMATAYGQSLGLDSTGLLLALLVTQLVAFPFCLIFAKLAKRFSGTKLITVCIVAYFCIAVYAIQLDRQIEFWILAVCVGMLQGGIQALSRSYFAKIIPAEKSGEYFGLLDILRKGRILYWNNADQCGKQAYRKSEFWCGSYRHYFCYRAYFCSEKRRL